MNRRMHHSSVCAYVGSIFTNILSLFMAFTNIVSSQSKNGKGELGSMADGVLYGSRCRTRTLHCGKLRLGGPIMRASSRKSVSRNNGSSVICRVGLYGPGHCSATRPPKTTPPGQLRVQSSSRVGSLLYATLQSVPTKSVVCSPLALTPARGH